MWEEDAKRSGPIIIVEDGFTSDDKRAFVENPDQQDPGQRLDLLKARDQNQLLQEHPRARKSCRALRHLDQAKRNFIA